MVLQGLPGFPGSVGILCRKLLKNSHFLLENKKNRTNSKKQGKKQENNKIFEKQTKKGNRPCRNPRGRGKNPSFLQNCISACTTRIFRSSFFLLLLLFFFFAFFFFFLLSQFVIWIRSHQKTFSMVLVLQKSAFLDLVRLNLDRICLCPQSVYSADHLADSLAIFAAAPTELSKMVSVATLLASSFRSTFFGSPACCVNCTLYLGSSSTITLRQFSTKMSDRMHPLVVAIVSNMLLHSKKSKRFFYRDW